MAWYDGRTFFACPCGARDERTGGDQPRTIQCWSCKQKSARQWLPPAVARERQPALRKPGHSGQPVSEVFQHGVSEWQLI